MVSGKNEADPNFLESLLFSDKANFYVNREVSSQNYLYWSHENPHWYAPSTERAMAKLWFDMICGITTSLHHSFSMTQLTQNGN
jgi:hypothetical protein